MSPAPRPPSTPPPPAGADPLEQRKRRIDESLTRLTAAHAGLARDEPEPAEPVEADPDDPDGYPSEGTGSHAAHRPPAPMGVALRRVGRFAALAVAVLLFAGAALGWGTKTWFNTKIRTVAALDPGSESIINPAGQAGDENFLLIGSDTTAASQGTASGSGDAPGAGSDAVMVVHIPADRSRVVVISFPRALEVNRPPCSRWDGASASYTDQLAPAEARTTLSSAFEVGGPRCATRVIQQLTGLAITRFVGVGLGAVRDMTNAVDGVELCSPRPVVDGELGPIVPNPGSTVLDGDAALNYVQARNVRGEPTAAYGQIERQQRLLSALLARVLSNQVLLDPGRLGRFFSAFAAETITDRAGADELQALAQSLQRAGTGTASFLAIPTVGTPNSRGNEVLVEPDTKALFGALRDGRALPAAPKPSRIPTADAASGQVEPGDVKVRVLNASDRKGLAGEVGATLTGLGFTVLGVGDAAPGTPTTIRFAPDGARQAELLAAAVPSAVLTPDATVSDGVALVLGGSFDGVVTPPAGTPPDVAQAATGTGSCS